jgi:hypothetical protein
MPNQAFTNTFDHTLREHLNRLARFGANLTESHSCFIFLPPSFLNRGTESEDNLIIGGYHSLCHDLLPNCIIKKGSGLIGWVAQHSQPIHVSPFEHDSRTLGMYKDDRQLKSLIGVPISLKRDLNKEQSLTGVLICDSKKSFAFSKIQGKLLTELAEEISTSVSLLYNHYNSKAQPNWSEFIASTEQLIQMLGSNSVEILRVRVNNFHTLEAKLGISSAVELVQQFYRLVQQSLPPHFPFYLLPNGDCLLILDNMMSSFYENRLVALAEHISKDLLTISLEFNRQALRSRKVQFNSIEEAISSTSFNLSNPVGDTQYEYRRA